MSRVIRFLLGFKEWFVAGLLSPTGLTLQQYYQHLSPPYY